MVGAGLVLFARAPVHASYVADLLAPMVLLGVGAGLAFSPLVTLAMSAATPEDSGLASGLVNTTQQVGGALGLAVLATISTTHTHTLLRAGDSNASALTSGYHVAFTIGAILVAVALALAVGLLRSQPNVAVAENAAEGVPADGEFAYEEAA
jgi:MFS family permease